MSWPANTTAWPPSPVPNTVRDVIRELIVTGVPEVGGRVYEHELAPSNPQTPFITYRVGNDTTLTDWGAYGTPLVVWPWLGLEDEAVTYTLLDYLGGKIVQAVLQGQAGVMLDEAAALGQPVQLQAGVPGARYVVAYAGVNTQDTRDETLQLISRPVQFNLMRTNWRPEVDHPVLRACRTWSNQLIPASQVETLQFAPQDNAPSLYWRFNSLPIVDEDINWDIHHMLCQVQCHVLCPDANWRQVYVAQLAAGIANTYEGSTVQDPITEWRIGLRVARAEANADPATVGQLAIDAMYYMVDPEGFPAVDPIPSDPRVYPVDPANPPAPGQPAPMPGLPPDALVAHVWLNGRPMYAHVDGPAAVPPGAWPTWAGPQPT